MEKTCLTAMYVSTSDDRAAGYGLPSSEYCELYEFRDEQAPLPRSQFWIGRFGGSMAWSVRATPLVVLVDGLPEPEYPQGYAMTVVLGQLLLHGVRMTTPGLELKAGTVQEMPRSWPGADAARWPAGGTVSDDNYEAFALGRDLKVEEARPWRLAVELPASLPAGDMVELPTACGKHVLLSRHPGVRSDARSILRVCSVL